MQEVVLYGVGLDGEKFYTKYKNRYRFIFAVDQNNNRFFHGLPVYSFDEVKEELKNYFIYVAVGSDFSWQTIRKLLKEIGLREFEDFASKEFADKKLAIFYGNCHMHHVMRYLQANPEFDRRYEAKYYFKDIEDVDASVLKECSLFITQDIRDNNKLGLPSADNVANRLSPDHCKCIRVPNLFGCNLFFPQLMPCKEDEFQCRHQLHISEDGIDMSKISEPVAHKIKDLFANTLMWKDFCLEELYERRGGISQIADMMENGDVFSKEHILENFSKELTKLKERERFCDISISDYIENNYRTKQLFYEPFHPTNEVIFEKGRRILGFLQIPIYENCIVSDSLDGSEVFIYGCVRKALHLEFEQKYIRKSNIRWNYRFTLNNTPLTLEEYIEEYIAWNMGV